MKLRIFSLLLATLVLAQPSAAQTPPASANRLAWLDGMPTLAVALSALPMPDPMLSVNARTPGDEEIQIAAHIGTLMSLRRIMIDKSGIKDLDRMPEPMRLLAIGYLRAEHALGLRFAKIIPEKRGFFSKRCANPNDGERRIYRLTFEQCAFELLHRQVGTFERAYAAHMKGFPRMFGETLGEEYIQLARAHAMSTPAITTPGETLQLPEGARHATTLDCRTWGGDTDGDALCDFWELFGVPAEDASIIVPLEEVFDTDGDGRLGDRERPDPLRKDIYVEIDWLKDFDPYRLALADVVLSFTRAPVANPDPASPRLKTGGPTGIRLHLGLDEELQPATLPTFVNIAPSIENLALMTPCRTAYTHFDSIKKCHFGTARSRSLPNAAAIRQARVNVYRYALFVNEVVETVDGLTNGAAEIGGNDMIFSTNDTGYLGEWRISLVPGGEAHAVCGPPCLKLHASTFMHELGHTLGLRHGGGDDITCKPNYLGVMNYYEGYSGVLDYSRVELPTLNECVLDESAGLRGQWPADDARWPAARASLEGRTIAYGHATATELLEVDADSESIDWNGDGAITPGRVAVDIHLLKPAAGTLLKFLREECKRGIERSYYLVGQDDWSALQFNFRLSHHFAERTIWYEDLRDGRPAQVCPPAASPR